MAGIIILRIRDLSKHIGQDEIFKDITLAFSDGAKIGLTGSHGVGKSTLLRIIAGEDTEFGGSMECPEGTTTGYLDQEPQLNDGLSVWGNLQEALADQRKIGTRYNEVCLEMEGREDEFDALQEQMDHLNIWDLDSRLEQVAGALRLPPPDAEVKLLSKGERRRVALCMLLVRQPDILLLNEPTNHLDADTVEWLVQYLKECPAMVMLITHDGHFLDRIATDILVFEGTGVVPYHRDGGYESYNG